MAEARKDYDAEIEQEMAAAQSTLRGFWGADYDRQMKLANKYAESEGMSNIYLATSGVGRNPKAIIEMARRGSEIEKAETAAAQQEQAKVDAKEKEREEETRAELRRLKQDPRYWDQSRRDPRYVRQVEEAYKKHFPGPGGTCYRGPNLTDRDVELASASEEEGSEDKGGSSTSLLGRG